MDGSAPWGRMHCREILGYIEDRNCKALYSLFPALHIVFFTLAIEPCLVAARCHCLRGHISHRLTCIVAFRRYSSHLPSLLLGYIFNRSTSSLFNSYPFVFFLRQALVTRVSSQTNAYMHIITYRQSEKLRCLQICVPISVNMHS